MTARRHLLAARAGVLLGAAVTILTAGVVPARAQDALQQIKSLYASAAYEDALSVIARAQLTGRRPEMEQYRVFCLVALGRTAEAEKAIASVVEADPSFVPDAREMSPRIREMFARTRKALVPEIAQRLYMEGREALDRKDKPTAIARFEAVMRLIDSAAGDQPADAAEDANSLGSLLSELKVLASGFLDLSRAAAEPRPEPTRQTQARPSATAPALDIVAPTPIKQELPAWTPPDQSVPREFRGAVRVFISDAGKVTDAELAPSVHPAYDRLLLAAAKTWEYQPALRNGSPIASEKIIEVVLKPR
jgi:tetratricopeptide (TPR) repeat protein